MNRCLMMGMLLVFVGLLVNQPASAGNDPCAPLCTDGGGVGGGEDAFNGVGNLYYVGLSGSRRIHGANACAECEWITKVACDHGAPADPTDPCGNPSITCTASGGLMMRLLYFRRSPAESWGPPLTSLCLGGSNNLYSPQTFAPNLRQYFEAAAPEFTVASQPVGGRTLVNLDTIFYANYPTASHGRPQLDKTLDVLGFSVRIVATPSWTWTFDPGATETFDSPGDRYPAKTIVHRYSTLGARTIAVQASWKGVFYVAGDGPFDIAEPVTQARTAPLDVVATRSELIAAPGL